MPKILYQRIRGTLRETIILEFLKNSFHFPLANILIELVLEGPSRYLISTDFFASLAAPSVQAFFIGRRVFQGKPLPFIGNLIGPLIYSSIDYLSTPGEFVSMPFHYAYWGFSLAIGLIQELRYRLKGRWQDLTILIENMVRSSILAVMYWFIERLTESKYDDPAVFFHNKSHIFILLSLFFLSVVVGLNDTRAQRFLSILRDTAEQLTTYSRWLLGSNMLSLAITDPASLSLVRRERTILFMDIRGFTSWSEHQPPEKVVSMLNRYFEIAEQRLADSGVIQFKFTADEVMAFFESPRDALRTALSLQQDMANVLTSYDLQAGVGIHTGPVVEGLFGSNEFKRYDVIGDTVNTAKRICSAAAGGELLISEKVRQATGDTLKIARCREISAKGKSEPITVFEVCPGICKTNEGS
jgi:adenylate cyclase